MRLLLVAIGLLLMTGAGWGAEVRVAVAANFLAAAEELAATFQADTGHEISLSGGATGALYAQITQEAPFDIFLAADDKWPARAVAEGFAVGGSEFTYAIGTLVLFSPTIDLRDGTSVLREGAFQHLAIADPTTAPYGAAAMSVLAALALEDALGPKLVTGTNVTQTLQFVDSGNAELGFVALSQVLGRSDGFQWLVPQTLYPTIRQDAVLLRQGADNEAAPAFLEFIRSDAGRAVIEGFGYRAP